MAVPVSNGGGPVVVCRVTGVPEMVVTFGRVDDPEEPEVVVVCGGAEEPGNETVDVLEGFDVEDDEGGGLLFSIGVGESVGVPGCLFRRRSRCLWLSFSAFIEESCKAEKKTRA